MSKYRSPKTKKSIQATLQFKSTPTLVKCPKCSITYSTNSPSDLVQHKRYHDLHLNGKRWSQSWGDIINRVEALKTEKQLKYSMVSEKDKKVMSFQLPSQTLYEEDEYIVMISPKKANEVKAALDLMSIVNEELNAPHDENAFWSEVDKSGKSQGKAFIYVKKNRAVGVITIEYIENTNRGKWMVLDTKAIVPNVVPDVKLGISRIWVCRNQRQHGIATRLLEVARKKSIYGCIVNKWELAWSQPSQSGSILAKSYNAAKHRSGKLLIPCYI
ncbi:Eco1p [Kluyveromyces lactis]|uniref:N-acetyltransferase ECO1 n=1 Tax=Kluyveromyces lactis (strain ATCC 8585 / CBS 2359 / DSM 70799 / NBRC 1267 / NRRL Y-1140 / WM37) TaxID=284590 RepID=ECO1_KLULA|nr:uncharacterized protein KLLA0_B06644g [Kluyveromyces lactis]Q6CW60.1 RecName: Full=N-acetyltransferase ECO1; AltName: Full=Establishment of cohesion protein 1 [Kluyveromyces lactis NRRL Y-1140]CAH02222.1 KLLA0B06644p [Kluyveromyces lactis]|eukprot:XP_451829.1 uncharacterized protein KLLA0_B06644g [Kluyveromyces lactis]